MSAFLYFIEDHDGFLGKDHLEKYALTHIVDDGKPPYNAAVDPGPSGGKGWIVCDQPGLGDWQPVYRGAEQTWRKRPRGPEYTGPNVWVGFYTKGLPQPKTLARDKQLDGYSVELNGGKWQVPLVRLALSGSTATAAAVDSTLYLPRYVDIDDLGKPIPGDVVDQYRELAGRCDGFWDAWYTAMSAAVEGGKREYAIELESIVEDAVYVLGVNYRVSLLEVAMLRLFRNDRGAAEVLRAAVDADRAEVLVWKKKAEAPGGTSS